MKISVVPVKVRGKRKFMVSWKPAGSKRLRRYFPTRGEADAEIENLSLQFHQTGEAWLALPADDRAELLQIWEEAKTKGVNLREALDAYRPGEHIKKRIQEAFDDFMVERKASRVSKRTLAALKSNVGRFVDGRSQVLLSEVKRKDVMDWLAGLKPRTFNTYLTSLNTFFRWCVKLKYLKDSPAAAIEKVAESRMDDLDEEPAILTPSQCVALLAAARAIDPGLVPYIAICLFAGLRPEREAAKLTWEDVRSDEILVRGLHAKDRQRRHVPITPGLRLWLDLGGDLPPRNLRRRFQIVRREAGLLDSWKQDCMRHTFASCSLVVNGAEKTIAALGHGDYEMLFGHYRALTTQEKARVFWSVHPSLIDNRLISLEIDR